MDAMYSIINATYQRNNLLTASVTATGSESMEIMRSAAEIGSKGYLLVSGTIIYSISPEQISAINQSGDNLWTHKTWPDSKVVIFKNCIYCQSVTAQDKLDIIDSRCGITLTNRPGMPAVDNLKKLIFFQPHETSYLASSLSPSKQKLKDGKAVTLPPNFVIYCCYNDKRDFIWLAESYDAIHLPIITTPDEKLIIVVTDKKILIYDANPAQREPSPIRSIDYPLSIVNNICTDLTGNLCLLGPDNKKDQLVQCDNSGKLLWKWEHSGIAGASSIIAIGSNSEVLVCDSSKVFCIKDGKEQWNFDCGFSAPEFITTTTDGSVLIAAGDTLFCCKEGRKIFSYDAGASIIAAPVVDADGNVYILTPAAIVKVL